MVKNRYYRTDETDVILSSSIMQSRHIHTQARLPWLPILELGPQRVDFRAGGENLSGHINQRLIVAGFLHLALALGPQWRPSRGSIAFLRLQDRDPGVNLHKIPVLLAS